MKKILVFLIVSSIICTSLIAQSVEGPEARPSENTDVETTVPDSETESEEKQQSEESNSNEEKPEESPSENISKDKKKKKSSFNLFDSKYNEKGDQYIRISLMAAFPLNFGGSFPLYEHGQISIGGAGELGYHRFLTSWFAIGADVSFGYNPTLEKNTFTYVPILLTATFQPAIGRFEFPVTIGIGMAYETYLKYNYFPGFVFKPQFGVFFRASPGWSFGLETEFLLMPQIYDDSKYNFVGCFQTLGIGARYHF